MKKLLIAILACALLLAPGCSEKTEENNGSSTMTWAESSMLEEGSRKAAQLVLDHVDFGEMQTLLRSGKVSHGGTEYYLIVSGTDVDTGTDIEFTPDTQYYVSLDHTVIYEYDEANDSLTELWRE